MPRVPLGRDPDGFATLIVQGVDSVQESADIELRWTMPRDWDAARAVAQERGDKGLASIMVGGEQMFMRAGAPAGHCWVMGNDDFLLMVRRPHMPAPVSVRYLAAGLWEYGYRRLRERVGECLLKIGAGRRPDWQKMTRVDYAFDFHSPAMTRAMVPDIAGAVCSPSGAKVQTWGEGGRIETLTIGSKSGIQVQLYDKSAEIRQRPEKQWMADTWRAHGADPAAGNMWRLECRYGGEYLKNRNLRLYGSFIKEMPSMLAEALSQRRLTVPSATDSNRRRWPLHPLWTLALQTVDASAMPEIGRRVTGRRDVLMDGMKKQIVGLGRAVSVLETGGWDRDGTARYLAALGEGVEKQPGHGRKVEALQDRYQLVDEAG